MFPSPLFFSQLLQEHLISDVELAFQSRVSDSLLESDRVVSLRFLSSTRKGNTVTARGCGSHSVPLLWTPKLEMSQDLPEFHSSHSKELKSKREKLEILWINFLWSHGKFPLN